MGRQTGVRPKLISYPMISFHAPIPQTLTSLKRQHAKRATLMTTKLSQKERDVLRATRPCAGLMRRAKASVIIVLCYIVHCC